MRGREGLGVKMGVNEGDGAPGIKMRENEGDGAPGVAMEGLPSFFSN